MKPTGIYKGTLRYTWEECTLPPHHEIQCDAVMEVDFTVTPGEEATRDTPASETQVEWEGDRVIELRVYGHLADYVCLDLSSISKLKKDFLSHWKSKAPWNRLEKLALEEAAEDCQTCD